MDWRNFPFDSAIPRVFLWHFAQGNFIGEGLGSLYCQKFPAGTAISAYAWYSGGVHVHMHVRVFICVHVCTHTCVNMYVCTRVLHACVHGTFVCIAVLCALRWCVYMCCVCMPECCFIPSPPMHLCIREHVLPPWAQGGSMHALAGSHVTCSLTAAWALMGLLPRQSKVLLRDSGAAGLLPCLLTSPLGTSLQVHLRQHQSSFQLYLLQH